MQNTTEHHFPTARAFKLTDLYGPITHVTKGGNLYFLLAVGDYSRYMWIEMIKSKNKAFTAFRKINTRAESKVGTNC